MNKVVATLRLQGGVWGRLLEGTPTVLVQNGQFLDPALRKEGVERSQVLMAMREHGVGDIEEVQLAVLETDGSVSIVSKETPIIRTRKRVRQMRR